MATFTGTNANETISPDLVSATVTTDPVGAVPSGADDTLRGGGGDDLLVGGSGADMLYGDGVSSVFAAHDKYYQLIATNRKFDAALRAALKTKLNGVAGQLVTIHSAAENTFVSNTVAGGNLFWLGASDADTEGQWYWLDGAARAELFWTGNSSGSPVDGLYSNWYVGEPNDAGNEDAAVGNWANAGNPAWNDLPDSSAVWTAFAVVEWSQAEVGPIGGIDTADYSASSAGVVVNLAAGTGSGGDAAGDRLFSIENVIGSGHADTLTGDGAANVLTGLAGDDILDGGAGDDILDGGADDDTLDGRAGIDTATYASAAGGVTVSLAIVGAQDTGGAGTDTLLSIENLIGSAFADSLTGKGGANVLNGGAGNDRLVGGGADDTLDGGTGADAMDGGDGNDLYIVDDVGDVVVADSGGLDTVQSSVSFTLAAMLENLTLTGRADIDGTGNGKANVIAGTRGDNVLAGLGGNDTLLGAERTDRLFGGDGNDMLDGGLGKDIMEGGDGDDLYIVDNVKDIARERASASGGIDTVQASVSHMLGRYVENLMLTGRADIDGTGNEADNTIVGNSGRNVLSGLGGNDVLTGDAGKDTLLGGDGDDVLDGGTGSDVLSGGDGDDVLNGGAGDNVSKGGAGNDMFRFDTPLVAGDLTTITDMTAGADRIALAAAIFADAGAVGPLAAAAFYIGSAAHDASDRIIYDTATGNLMYDADGTGAAAASIFAKVSTGLTLSAGDFMIV